MSFHTLEVTYFNDTVILRNDSLCTVNSHPNPMKLILSSVLKLKELNTCWKFINHAKFTSLFEIKISIQDYWISEVHFSESRNNLDGSL